MSEDEADDVGPLRRHIANPWQHKQTIYSEADEPQLIKTLRSPILIALGLTVLFGVIVSASPNSAYLEFIVALIRLTALIFILYIPAKLINGCWEHRMFHGCTYLSEIGTPEPNSDGGMTRLKFFRTYAHEAEEAVSEPGLKRANGEFTRKLLSELDKMDDCSFELPHESVYTSWWNQQKWLHEAARTPLEGHIVVGDERVYFRAGVQDKKRLKCHYKRRIKTGRM